jgi:t-SNARE complex subunit (syntaxin)
MQADEEIKQVLIEIRDNQREFLQRQAEHLDIAKRHLEQARSQIAESMSLQREAVARAKNVGRIAVPGIVVCIAAILYLILKYF